MQGTWLRFTIRDLILATVFLGVGCAALKYPTAGWWSVLSIGALLAMLAAIIIAIVDHRLQRAQAIGFLAGFVLYYFLLARQPLPFSSPVPTAAMIEWLSSLFSITDVSITDGRVLFRFHAICHLLFALALAIVGSRFAGWVYRARKRRESENSA